MKIVIVGGIAAGTSAVAKAKRLMPDAQCVMYEKGDVVSFGACGLPYYVGDFFQDENEMIARRKEDFEKTGVKVQLHHEVLKVTPAEKKVTVKNLQTGEIFTDTYDQLMIATGSTPVMPPFKNPQLANISLLKTLEDGKKIKQAVKNPAVKEVVIVGGGFIGLELVEAMEHLGKHVTVIQLEDRLMPDAFDEEITSRLQEELENHGVRLHLSEKVLGFVGDQHATAIITDQGEIPCDFVIVATGVKPNTKFLADTGLNFSPNGAIIIDHYGRTNLPDIFSAGDCATVPSFLTDENIYLPLATMANKMGRIVGENLAGKNHAFSGSVQTSGLKVLDCEAARTGLSEGQAKALGLSYGTVFIKDKNHTSYYPGQEDIFIKLVYEKETKILLGAQIAGVSGAVLRIDTMAAAISKRMTTEELGFLDVVYAPPFARTWDAMNVAGNVAK